MSQQNEPTDLMDPALALMARRLDSMAEDLRLIRDHGMETRRLQFEHDESKHGEQHRQAARINELVKRVSMLEREAESNRQFHEDAQEPIADVRFMRKAMRAVRWLIGLGAAAAGLIAAVITWKGGPP